MLLKKYVQAAKQRGSLVVYTLLQEARQYRKRRQPGNAAQAKHQMTDLFSKWHWIHLQTLRKDTVTGDLQIYMQPTSPECLLCAKQTAWHFSNRASFNFYIL